MGTITLDNGVQVRQVLGFYYLAIKPTLYTDVPNYHPDQKNIYDYYVYLPNHIQGIYKRYQQGNTSDLLVLWYTVPFQINGNVLYGDIPIRYSISDQTYTILDTYGIMPAGPDNPIGAIPVSAGSGSDTADRVYFPNWKVDSVNYQNSVYVMKQPIVNHYPIGLVRDNDHQIWVASFNGMSKVIKWDISNQT